MFTQVATTPISSQPTIEIPSDLTPDVPLQAPTSLVEAALLIIPVAISLTTLYVRESISAKVKRLDEEHANRMEEQRAEVRERAQLIDHLQEQNRLLLQEISNLRRVMEISGPVSYELVSQNSKTKE